MLPPQQSYSFTLDKSQQDLLAAILYTGPYKPETVPHTLIAVSAPSYKNTRVNLYNSGKCLIQGKGAREFVEFVMEPEVLKATPVTNFSGELSEEAKTPHIGVDESGKGDFFGPLVVAAAFSNENIAEKMHAAGVRDSKTITTDEAVRAAALRIHNILGANRYHIMILPPEKYNSTYSKIRSVNRILAWYHATCIENLTRDRDGNSRLAFDFAISDQFGDESLVLRELKKKNLAVELRQRHRAEEDLAVAAASILARATFVKQVKLLSDKFGVALPKGASEQVKAAAAELLQRHGPDVFIQTAKCHFKTLDVTLGKAGRSRDDMPPEGRVKSQERKVWLRCAATPSHNPATQPRHTTD